MPNIKAVGTGLKPVGDHNTNPFVPPSIPQTLIGCSRCDRGWPPKYMVAGMCRDCASNEVQMLKGLLLDVLHEFGVEGDLEPKYAVLRQAQKLLGKDFPEGLYFGAVFVIEETNMEERGGYIDWPEPDQTYGADDLPEREDG